MAKEKKEKSEDAQKSKISGTTESGKKEEVKEGKPKIFALRTTANREDQVMDFVSSNAAKKKLGVYSIIRVHGMRSYVFLEAISRAEAEQSAFNVPYARGVLPKEIDYSEIEHMLEPVKVEMNIQKNDIVEIIAGPFKREQAKVSRIDKSKEEVVLELLEAAVPIPITVKMDSVKVIRRETEEGDEEEEKEKEMPIPGLIHSTEKKEKKKKEFVDDKVEEPVEEAKEEIEEKEEAPVVSSMIKIKTKKKNAQKSKIPGTTESGKAKEPAEEIEEEIEREEAMPEEKEEPKEEKKEEEAKEEEKPKEEPAEEEAEEKKEE